MLDHTSLNDLREREFSRAIRGYAIVEVDEFIENLLTEAAELVDSVASLSQKINEIQEEREELKKREEQLSSTLIVAQSTAEEWRALAKKDAEQIVREANLKADEILRQAHRESEELLRQSQDNFKAQEESRARLHQDMSLTVARLKGELDSLKEAVERWEQRAFDRDDRMRGPQ